MVYNMVILEVRNGDDIITVYNMIVLEVRNGDLQRNINNSCISLRTRSYEESLGP